jgi:hypothetical protein
MSKSLGFVMAMALAGGAAHGQALPACSGTNWVVQETTQTNCAVVNPGGKIATTNTDVLAPTVVNTQTSQTVDDYATTLTAKLNGNIVFQESFAAPLTAASGATAVAQADAALTADGAISPSPVLATASTTLQSTTLAYVPTSPTLTLAELATCALDSGTCAGVSYQDTTSTVETFGPASVQVGLGATDSFAVLSGQLLINVINSLGYTVTQNAVTTNTDLVSQNYVINATTSTVQAPEISGASASTAITLLFGSLAVLRGRRARPIGGT